MKYQFFWQATFLKAGEEKKNKGYVGAEEDALEKRLIMGATPCSSTSKLVGGRSFWNLSRWIYSPSSFPFHKNYGPPVEHPDF